MSLPMFNKYTLLVNEREHAELEGRSTLLTELVLIHVSNNKRVVLFATLLVKTK